MGPPKAERTEAFKIKNIKAKYMAPLSMLRHVKAGLNMLIRHVPNVCTPSWNLIRSMFTLENGTLYHWRRKQVEDLPCFYASDSKGTGIIIIIIIFVFQISGCQTAP